MPSASEAIAPGWSAVGVNVVSSLKGGTVALDDTGGTRGISRAPARRPARRRAARARRREHRRAAAGELQPAAQVPARDGAFTAAPMRGAEVDQRPRVLQADRRVLDDLDGALE